MLPLFEASMLFSLSMIAFSEAIIGATSRRVMRRTSSMASTFSGSAIARNNLFSIRETGTILCVCAISRGKRSAISSGILMRGRLIGGVFSTLPIETVMLEEVKQIVVTFARFEKNGTLPNTIFGEDASNRDTSDAPLWFAVVCEELARLLPTSPANPVSLYDTPVDKSGRPLRDVLASITLGYINGTPNGIRMGLYYT